MKKNKQNKNKQTNNTPTPLPDFLKDDESRVVDIS